jgi:hypothetical protein
MKSFSFFKAVLKVIVDILAMLIGAEGARLLREYGTGENPAGGRSPEEAPRTARAALSAWSGNQQASITQPFFKKFCQLYKIFVITIDYSFI